MFSYQKMRLIHLRYSNDLTIELAGNDDFSPLLVMPSDDDGDDAMVSTEHKETYSVESFEPSEVDYDNDIDDVCVALESDGTPLGIQRLATKSSPMPVDASQQLSFGDYSTTLVFHFDQPLTSDFSFLLYSQMQPCVLTKSDQDDTDLHVYQHHFPEGYPGIICKHCLGEGGRGKCFWKENNLCRVKFQERILTHLKQCVKTKTV